MTELGAGIEQSGGSGSGGAPGGAAGGVLGGTYPDPGFAADMATQAELDAHINDTTAAHAATAISVDSATLVGTGTNVQSMAEEFDDAIAANVTAIAANSAAIAAAVPKSLFDANTVLAASANDIPEAITMGASTILARLAAGVIKAATPAELNTLLATYTVGGTDVAIADGGTGASTAGTARTNLGLAIDTDVPSQASVVLNSLYNANTVLAATTDDTPAALTMGASTVLARLAAGNIVAATVAEMQTLLGTTVKIGGATLAATAANIDITSIPGTYSNLELVVLAQTTSLTAQVLNMTINGDGGTTYDWGVHNATGATGSAADSAGAVSFPITTITATSATGKSGLIIAHFPFYAGTALHKPVRSLGATYLVSGAGNISSRTMAGLWRNTAAITQITLTPAAGALAIGSAWALYGKP